MITKFKIFEQLEEWNKETGYYVILTQKGDSDRDKRMRNYLINNIGRITKMYYPGVWFDVEFENEPDVIKRNKTQFHESDILHISKNKEDLEPFIKSIKYNI